MGFVGSAPIEQMELCHVCHDISLAHFMCPSKPAMLPTLGIDQSGIRDL